MNVPPPAKAEADTSVRMRVGTAIKGRREYLKRSRPKEFTQAGLGKKLRNKDGKAISGGQVATWEQGRHLPETRLWPELADALETTMDSIFGGLLVQAPDELLVNRVSRLEAELAAVISVLRLEAAVAAATGEARATAASSPEEDQIADEIEAGVAEALQAEQDPDRRGSQESGPVSRQASRQPRANGS